MACWGARGFSTQARTTFTPQRDIYDLKVRSQDGVTNDCKNLKGQFNRKYKFWHHLLTIMFLQTCMTSFALNITDDILRNVSVFPNGSQCKPKLFGYQHSSKYLILCSTEESWENRYCSKKNGKLFLLKRKTYIFWYYAVKKFHTGFLFWCKSRRIGIIQVLSMWYGEQECSSGWLVVQVNCFEFCKQGETQPVAQINSSGGWSLGTRTPASLISLHDWTQA